ATTGVWHDRGRAGSPPSSLTDTTTGWPFTPPWSLIQRAQICTAVRLPLNISPTKPETVPTEPILTGDFLAGAVGGAIADGRAGASAAPPGFAWPAALDGAVPPVPP